MNFRQYNPYRAKKEKSGYIDLGQGIRTPENITSLAEENQQLRVAIKKLEKENRELKETNEFLEEASAFCAASRQKLKKRKNEIYSFKTI